MVSRFRHTLKDTKTMAFVRSFLRCYLVGTGFNTRGMQNIGLTFAMEPGLEVLHPNLKDLKEARKRYVRHYQSHPFWTPCLVGILLNVETAIAGGHFPPKMLAKVKDTTAYTLSAIGDSVFAGSLLICWALLTICLLLSGLPMLAFGLGATLLIGLQLFRAYTFTCGIKYGFRFLEQLRKWNLIDWGQRVKYLNTGLLLWLWILVWPSTGPWWQMAVGVTALMLFARFVRTGMISRVLAVAVVMVLIQLYPMFSRSLEIGF